MQLQHLQRIIATSISITRYLLQHQRNSTATTQDSYCNTWPPAGSPSTAGRRPQLAAPPASSTLGTGSSAPCLRASSGYRRLLPVLRAPPASSALGMGSSAPRLRIRSAGARSRPSPRGGAPAAPVLAAQALLCSRSAEPEEELWSRPPQPIL